MLPVTPTKGIKDLCSKLGEGYFITTIDKENVISKKLDPTHDIEISGADNNRKLMKVDIYVWETKPAYRIVEKHFGIRSFYALKTELHGIEVRYSNIG